MTFLAAVVQLTTTADSVNSMAEAARLIDEAARLGATLVALPENVNFMGPEEERRRHAEPLDGPTFKRLGEKAKEHRIWLLGGTLPERGRDETRAFNTSVLFSPDGARVAAYRKIHLFDVSLGEGATHTESRTVAPGEEAMLAETPLGHIGMSVCYDLRFPDLFRTLVRGGAEIFTVPAAFTVPTGRDHWEVLLRARAIENQCFVIAPAQVGQNTATRYTYGRSMIVSPWGTVLASTPDRPSVAVAPIDLEELRSLRKRLPCLAHERPDAYRLKPRKV